MSDGARILFQLLVEVPGVRDYTCGYRAYRAELLQRALAEFAGCLSVERGFACTTEILLRCPSLKARIEEVPLELRYDFKCSASKMDVPATALRLLRLAWKNRRLMSPRESRRNWRSVISPASQHSTISILSWLLAMQAAQQKAMDNIVDWLLPVSNSASQAAKASALSEIARFIRPYAGRNIVVLSTCSTGSTI